MWLCSCRRRTVLTPRSIRDWVKIKILCQRSWSVKWFFCKHGSESSPVVLLGKSRILLFLRTLPPLENNAPSGPWKFFSQIKSIESTRTIHTYLLSHSLYQLRSLIVSEKSSFKTTIKPRNLSVCTLFRPTQYNDYVITTKIWLSNFLHV